MKEIQSSATKTHLDRKDESRQSKATRVSIHEAAEGPEDVVLGGLSVDVHSGVLNQSRTVRLSRETIIPISLQRKGLSWVISSLVIRIHHELCCSLKWNLQESVSEV